MDLEPPERCPVCGTASLLERVEIVATPLKRSEPREDNVIWLCPSCHYELDRGSLQGFEFESVLARLMKTSGQFETDSVVQDAFVVGIDRQKRIDSVMQPISSSWNAKDYAEKIGKDHALGMVHDLNEDRGFRNPCDAQRAIRSLHARLYEPLDSPQRVGDRIIG